MATTNTAVRLPDDLRREITRTSEAVRLTFSETMRQAMTFGLPVLEKKLSKKAAK